jgi:hypothetical protein
MRAGGIVAKLRMARTVDKPVFHDHFADRAAQHRKRINPTAAYKSGLMRPITTAIALPAGPV